MRHCIIVKFKDEVTEERKKVLLPEIKALFDKTKEIEGIHKISLLTNVVKRPNRYDFMIEMEMEEASLPIYDDCIWHKQWKEQYGDLLGAKTIIDLE